MGHLGVVLYEYLGEEYPEVLGSILGALKAIVNVIGTPLPAYMRVGLVIFFVFGKQSISPSWEFVGFCFLILSTSGLSECHKVFFSYCPCIFYLNMLKGNLGHWRHGNSYSSRCCELLGERTFLF